MIPPHEINNKEFSRVVRGYSIPEVDEYIAYLREKYTELYRENDALQRRLAQADAELGELKAEESDIRAALITAQKAGKKIITDANTRAGRITMQTRIDCEKILEDFRRESAQERETLAVLKGQVSNLKQRLFEMYSSHISMIEQITPNINEEIAKMSAITDDEYAASLVAEIRGKSGVDDIQPTKLDPDETVSDAELAALARVFGDLSAKMPQTEQSQQTVPSDTLTCDVSTNIAAADALVQHVVETTVQPTQEIAQQELSQLEPSETVEDTQAEELLELLRRKAEEKQTAQQIDVALGITQAVPQQDAQTFSSSQEAEKNNIIGTETENLQTEQAAMQPDEPQAQEQPVVSQYTHSQGQPAQQTATEEDDTLQSTVPDPDETEESIFDTLRRLNETFTEQPSAQEFFDSLSADAGIPQDDRTELSIEEQLRLAYPDRDSGEDA